MFHVEHPGRQKWDQECSTWNILDRVTREFMHG
jgi:hypothetical protein